MRVLRFLGVVLVLFVAVKLLTAPIVGAVLGWCLLVYVIVRAVPAIRSDVRRLVGRRQSTATAEWRF